MGSGDEGVRWVREEKGEIGRPLALPVNTPNIIMNLSFLVTFTPKVIY